MRITAHAVEKPPKLILASARPSGPPGQASVPRPKAMCATSAFPELRTAPPQVIGVGEPTLYRWWRAGNMDQARRRDAENLFGIRLLAMKRE